MLELTIGRAFRAPLAYKGAITAKDLNAMTVRDENEVSDGMHSHPAREVKLTVSGAWRTPLSDKDPVGIKYLHAVIEGINNKDEFLGRMDGYTIRANELTIALAA